MKLAKSVMMKNVNILEDLYKEGCTLCNLFYAINYYFGKTVKMVNKQVQICYINSICYNS